MTRAERSETARHSAGMRLSPNGKYTAHFDALFKGAGTEIVKLPPRSLDLNSFAERWVKSCKNECLDQMILFGEKQLRYVLREYLAHYHAERNHQGIDNEIPLPDERVSVRDGPIVTHERLGGLLSFYHREAAWATASEFCAYKQPERGPAEISPALIRSLALHLHRKLHGFAQAFHRIKSFSWLSSLRMLKIFDTDWPGRVF